MEKTEKSCKKTELGIKLLGTSYENNKFKKKNWFYTCLDT